MSPVTFPLYLPIRRANLKPRSLAQAKALASEAARFQREYCLDPKFQWSLYPICRSAARALSEFPVLASCAARRDHCLDRYSCSGMSLLLVPVAAQKSAFVQVVLSATSPRARRAMQASSETTPRG